MILLTFGAQMWFGAEFSVESGGCGVRHGGAAAKSRRAYLFCSAVERQDSRNLEDTLDARNP